MQRRPYPTKGKYRLDDVAGMLYYHGQEIGPVALLHRIQFGDHVWYSVRTGGYHFQRMMDVLRQEGIPNPLLYAFYQCAGCGGWGAGSGYLWCSAECQKADRAAKVRQRRAAARVQPHDRCVICDDKLPASRTTRRYCSDRCRQAAYRTRIRAQ
jgi:hypothetical protein